MPNYDTLIDTGTSIEKSLDDALCELVAITEQLKQEYWDELNECCKQYRTTSSFGPKIHKGSSQGMIYIYWQQYLKKSLDSGSRGKRTKKSKGYGYTYHDLKRAKLTWREMEMVWNTKAESSSYRLT